jgi:predicted SAM-dependent methyltransferase
MQASKQLAKLILRRVGNTELNQARLQRRLSHFDRVNVGCGEDAGSGVPGWLNVGLFSDKRLPYGTLKREGARAILHFDMTVGIPVPNNQIRFIYASHFIEHLSLAHGTAFFRECCRILQPGGRIRITTPDLGLWLENYVADEKAFFDSFYAEFQSFPDLKTKGEILVGQIQGWGHQWLYDFDSLSEVMSRAGFAAVCRSRYHESSFPEIEKLEPDEPGRVLETLYVEAQKE